MKTQSKKIFFDTTNLHYYDMRGVCRVIIQLVRLLLNDSRFKDIQFISTLQGKEKVLDSLGVPESRIEIVSPPFLIGKWERFHGAFVNWRYRKIKKQAVFIIHPEFRTVVDPKIPQAVMLHDLIFFEPVKFSGKRKWVRLFYYWLKCRYALKAKYIWGNSAFTNSQATKFFPFTSQKELKVLHLSARSETKPAAGIIPRILHKNEQINILYVGSFEEKKNFIPMLKHLNEIFCFPNFHFHIAGPSNESQLGIINNAIAENGISNQTTYHGTLDSVQLKELYNDCHFLLFPSLMEGFGMPLLEAMAFGLVTCAFNNSAIPEVVGDAAILAENDDFASWGKEIKNLVNNPEKYTEYSKRSLARAAEFTEEKMFERYGNYFESILKETLN